MEREQTITSTREKGFYAIAIATALMLLVIVVQILIIRRDSRKIREKEDESEDLIRKQKQMLAENEELLNARQKMMHTITHELRIPLSSIIGYAGLLEEETDKKVQQEYMGNIKQAAERMTSQLNSLLSFFRLDCGKEEVNLYIFRHYVEYYLKHHPKVHQDMIMTVRQLQPTAQGMPIELYFFSADTAWLRYEHLQAEVFDHVLAMLHIFGLKVFQSPTGLDLKERL